ncbi:hypothetical protein DPMN_125920 [Dreissena polymorpha]|uniref:Uncharacterized protein n=1 Tax=Dreissena polymorpha TaxID=45954 RepID=A0A9D4JXH3_DREPO|nr:hypothetical protein DPMN_125920 [Dreissena polymorpha]
MDAVRCYIGSRKNTWDENLQQIAAAMRSAVCRSTDFTANRMMLGREVFTPADLVYQLPSHEAQPVMEWLEWASGSHEAGSRCAVLPEHLSSRRFWYMFLI